MGKVLDRSVFGSVVVLLAAFVMGCGGDDDPSTSAGETPTEAEPEPVTKKDFIKEADAICKEGQDAFAKLLDKEAAAQAKANAPETLASEDAVKKAADEVAKVTDDLADTQARATKALKEVEAPPGEDIVEKWAKLRAAATADIRKVADAWRAYGKSPTQETADAIRTASEQQQKSADESRRFVRGYGFKQCGKLVKAA